jgi:hypothetical protein
MVINSFPDVGVAANSSSESFTLRGSYIGVLADGMTAAPNLRGGVTVGGLGAQIGGTSGTTPGGPCTGDCNVISANLHEGILIFDQASDAVIQGNFIGLDASGTKALSNDDMGKGIYVFHPGATIGGTSPSARNVVFADDGGIGILLFSESATVQGNLIGTDSAGSALPSGVSQPGSVGIQIHEPGSLIGGGLPGAGNVISGFLIGMALFGGNANNNQVRGNLIGTAVDGVTPIPNVRGISIDDDSNIIGGPGEGNVIANSSLFGISVNTGDGNTIRGNSIHSNGTKGIALSGGGNLGLAPPVISGFGSVHGTACPGCIIDVYSDDEDEGRTYEGTTTADGSGDWTFNGTPAGPFVTATATDAGGNTSEFSAPVAVTSPTPTASPTASPTPTPTTTATASPTPTTTVSATPASPTPSGQVHGDADCSGVVDTADILAALSELGGIPPGACDERADANCDGAVDGQDALLIAFHLADVPKPQASGCPAVGGPQS